jgi:hypothetical protein
LTNIEIPPELEEVKVEQIKKKAKAEKTPKAPPKKK